MRRQKLMAWKAAGLFLALVLVSARGYPEEPAAEAKSPPALPPADSLRDLQAQVRELSVALAEMRQEMSNSRSEEQQLRQELQETRERLSSLGNQLDLWRARQTVLVSNASAPGTAPVAASRPAQPGAPKAAEQPGEDRTAQLEEEQQLLSGKIDDQYQTKVESASKRRVRLSGIALLNVFGNRGSVDNQDVPTFAKPKGPLESRGNFGATVRQSSLGLELFGPTVANAKTSAEIQFDFFGGFAQTTDGVTAGQVRMRTATMRFDWARTSIVAGQDAPFISPLSPTSLASLAFPAFSYSGNLWTWTPQIRVERRMDLSDTSSILIQGGILDPLTGEPPYDLFMRSPQAGEGTGQPAYATRLAWTNSVLGRPMTVGAGGYFARQNWGFGRIVDAWAGTADWNLPLGRWFSLTGEFYRGQAIGGLGGGMGRSVLYNGLLTSPSTSVLGLNAVGGWAQLKFRPTERLEFNGAFGADDSLSSDLRRFAQSQSYLDASLARNQSAFVNSIYRLRSNLLLSLEYRRLKTSDIYANRDTANQVNMAVGVLF